MDETHFEFRPGPGCPTREALEALAAGGAVGPAIGEHVRGCAICQTLVRQLRGESLDLGPLLKRLDETAATSAGETAEVGDDEANLVPGYRILETIGEGGQGAVFRAVQESTKQVVALKLLRAGRFATARQRARVEREAELVASLRHPGIVVIHDRLPAKGGQYAIVMELIEGLPLDRWRSTAEREGERRREALRVFVRMCDAVAFAHRNGVIHRDLKPSNVLVDAGGQPHLLDFGIAKALDDRYAELTMTGDALFTPAYASPEQVMQEATDTLTDVYSLGVILYKLVCGRFPYTIEGSIREIAAAICEEAPTPPREVDRAIDADLETIMLRALQKERSRRYASVAELGEDVDRYLRQLPILARRDSTLYVLGMWVKRKRRLVGLLAAAGVLLAGAGVFARAAKLAKEEADQEKQKSTDAMALYRGEADRSSASSEIMRQLVESVDPAIASGSMSKGGASDNPARARIQYMLIEADQSITRRTPEALATISSELASVAVSAGEFSSAESGFTQAIVALKQRREANDPSLARARFGLAELYLSKDRQYLDAAKSLSLQALEGHRRRFGETSPEFAESLDQLARVEWQGGRHEDALRTLDAAQIALRGDSSHTPDRRSKSVESRLRRTEARFAAVTNRALALERWSEALRLSFEVDGDRHPRTLGILLDEAECLVRSGVTAEEVGQGRRLGALAETLRSPRSPCALAESLEELVALKKRLFPNPLDPNLAETYVAIGIQWMILKDYARAAAAFGEALPILETSSVGVEPVLNCLEQIALNDQFADSRSANAVNALVRFVNLSATRDAALRTPTIESQRASDLASILIARGLRGEAARAADLAMQLASRAPFTLRVVEAWERAGWVLVKSGAAMDGARALDAACSAYSQLGESRARVRTRVAARRVAALLLAKSNAEQAFEALDQELVKAPLPIGDAGSREALAIVIHELEKDGDMARALHVSWWLHADLPPPNLR